jgi:hypothetical protein
MKKTLRVLALAAVVALSSWATNVEATEGAPELEFFQALQNLAGDHQVSYSGGLTPFLASENVDDYCGDDYHSCIATCSPDDSLCYQECQCFLALCRGWACDC